MSEAKHDDNGHLHDKIDKSEEDDEVVEAFLPVLHFIRVPVRNPVNHPQEINNPSDYKEDY